MKKLNSVQGFQNFIFECTERLMQDLGSISPNIILHSVDKKGEIQPYMIGVSSKLLDDKEKLYTQVIPQSVKELVGKNKLKYGVWISEATARSTDKKTGVETKKEVLFYTFVDKNGQRIYTSDMIDKGQKVNEKGDLVRNIELTKPVHLNGNTSGPLSACLQSFF